MIAVGRLVHELCVETRAGWSWMVPLESVENPGLLVFHGPNGGRSAAGEGSTPTLGASRLELWSSGGATRPLVVVPVSANQPFRDDLHRVWQSPVDPRAGWLLLLSLLHTLDEAARARPRTPTVGEALFATGVPTLPAWASALTLGDLEAALLRARL